MYLHSVSSVESWVCIFIYWACVVCMCLESWAFVGIFRRRAERVSSFSLLCREMSACLHVPRELSVCVCVHVWRAERVYLGMFLHVADHIKSWASICILLAHIESLHSLACIESWVFVCMWLERWAFSGMFREMSKYLPMAFSSLCWELCVCLHVLRVCCLHVPRFLACFESWACTFIHSLCRELCVSFLPVLSVCRLHVPHLLALSVHLHSVSSVKSWACVHMFLHVPRAWHVPACVYLVCIGGWTWYHHVCASIKSWARTCMS